MIISFDYILRRTAESYGNSTFNFFRNLHTMTLHIHEQLYIDAYMKIFVPITVFNDAYLEIGL
jgi:hypothetical protein